RRPIGSARPSAITTSHEDSPATNCRKMIPVVSAANKPAKSFQSFCVRREFFCNAWRALPGFRHLSDREDNPSCSPSANPAANEGLFIGGSPPSPSRFLRWGTGNGPWRGHKPMKTPCGTPDAVTRQLAAWLAEEWSVALETRESWDKPLGH